jgi:Rod binding domain-containing protein
MAMTGVGQSLQLLATLDPTDRGGAVPKGDRAVLKKVAQEFESIFIESMFREMRNSAFSGGIIGQDRATKMYQEMSDQAVAKNMSEAGGIGIARMIEAELGRNLRS